MRELADDLELALDGGRIRKELVVVRDRPLKGATVEPSLREEDEFGVNLIEAVEIVQLKNPS